MQKINAIDLDKTLIPFDSFNFIIKAYLKQKLFITPLTFYVILRKLRLINIGVFKKCALCILKLDRSYPELLERTAYRIKKNINPSVLNKIYSETDMHTLNVIVSASPSDYVKMIAEELNWKSIGAELNGRDLTHPYREEKIKHFKEAYPPERYIYNYAVSDSANDLSLLKAFKKYEIINLKDYEK